jgi:hypothetical protein
MMNKKWIKREEKRKKKKEKNKKREKTKKVKNKIAPRFFFAFIKILESFKDKSIHNLFQPCAIQ